MSKKSSSKVPPPLYLTIDLIADLADFHSFKLGEQYYKEGAVQNISLNGNHAIAVVQGAELYRTEISVMSNGWIFSCTCPIDTDERACQHCVAVALACVHGALGGEEANPGQPDWLTGDVAVSLSQLEKEDLAAILMERAAVDESLQRDLQRRIDELSERKFDPAPYREMIDQTTRLRRSLRYYDSIRFADSIRTVGETLAELITDQLSASVLVPLIERTITRVERQAFDADDSSGKIGDALQALTSLHLHTCLIARPDSISLARRLFVMARESWNDSFYDAYASYSELLGEPGRRKYRELADSVWKELKPAKNPSDNDWNRRAMSAIMETIARAEGDVDLLLAVKQKDLMKPQRYLEIAEILRAAGRSDEALDWAEHGVALFQEWQGPGFPLVRFLAEEYGQRGRKQDALDATWNLYTQTPSVEAFMLLKEQAAHLDAWETWRPKAIEMIAEQCGDRAAGVPRSFFVDGDVPSLLVEILIADGDDGAASDMATAYGCREDVWLHLAAVRSEYHPEESLVIYRSRIEKAMGATGQNVYEKVVDLLKSMELIYRREGRDEEFIAEVNGLRKSWKHRPSFIRKLDEAFSSGE